jgi:DNA-binding LacI/PurR family transcriptional regulator
MHCKRRRFCGFMPWGLAMLESMLPGSKALHPEALCQRRPEIGIVPDLPSFARSPLMTVMAQTTKASTTLQSRGAARTPERKSPVRSLDELAKLAGVSTSTASRALAGNTLIAAKTRERIQALAKEHGFTVNPAARMLRTRQSHTIALVLPLGHDRRQHLSDPFFMAMLAYLADQISSRGYDLLLRRIEPVRENWLREIIDSTRVDGVLIIGQSDQAGLLDDMGKTYRPMVVWGQWSPGQSYLSVGADNVAGGRLAAEHLLARGRSRLAFLGNVAVPEFEARYRGFLSMLPPEVHERHVIASASLTAQDASAAALQLLSEHPDIDGVFAGSDVVAMSVIRAAVASGRSVPGDLSVIGFDDVPLAAQSNPPLTTIRQDLEQGSAQMCNLLFQRMKGEKCSSIRLAPELIIRSST